MSAERARDTAITALDSYHNPEGPEQYVTACGRLADALRKIIFELRDGELNCRSREVS